MGSCAALAIVALILASSTISLFAAEPTPCEKAQAELTAANTCADKEKAEQAYRSITAYYSGCHPQAAEAQLHIGEIFQNKKMCTDAAAAYEAVVAGFKDQTDLCIAALGKMGRTYRAAGKLNEALASFKRIADGYPSRPQSCADGMLSRAEIFEEAGNYRKAEAECRKLLQRYNTDPLVKTQCRTAHYRIPCEMKADGRLDEALKAFAGIKPDPDDTYAAGALLKRGQILTAQQKHDEAIQEFQSLLDNYPQHKNTCLQARFLMADSLLAKGDMAGVGAIVKDALKEEATLRGYPHMYHDILLVQRRSGDAGWRETAKKYVEGMKKAGYGGKADFAPLEVAYYFESNIKEATELSAEFLEKYPTHDLAPEAAFIRGCCLVRLGDREGALSVFDNLVTVYAKLPTARNYTNGALEAAARILANSGRIEEAIQRVRRVQATTPTEKASRHDLMGELYHHVGKWAEAAQAFSQELEVKGVPRDNYYRGLYWLGDCYARLGYTEEGRGCMQKILDQAPDSSWARKARGLLHLWGQLEGTADLE
ncbi:MAG: tetratricopeptide repeat protein [Armatimonadota bacterium]|nr:tetratricopeptide repeat protein [Armatimonadota bacterium]